MTFTRCTDPPPAGLLAGIDLFNQREFFDCHEILEDIWRADRDPVRLLYQGILQIGVGFYHLGNGNWRGAIALMTRGIDKVERCGTRCMGVETAKLVDESRLCLSLLHRLGAERIGEFDWSLVPVIAVERGAGEPEFG